MCMMEGLSDSIVTGHTLGVTGHPVHHTLALQTPTTNLKTP